VFTLFGYTFALAPAQLAALAVGALAVLAAAHLVGRRRRRLVVSTVDPWRLAPGSPRRLRLGWRLQRWLMFLLQAAIAGSLVLGLADPRPGGGGRPGRSTVLLLDQSASMGAAAVGTTRLQLARREARAVVAELRPGDQILVAGFARQLQLESDWTGDAEAAAAAIDRIEPLPQVDDLPGALAAARDLTAGRPQVRIVAIGDRPPGEAAAHRDSPGFAAVEYRSVGAPLDNVGIIGFSLARLADDPARAEAWVTLLGSGVQPRTVTFDLVSPVSGRSLARAQVEVPARGARAVRVLVPAAGVGEVAAVVRDPPPGPHNSLLADDRALAAMPAATTRRVLLISNGNLFLEGALRSLGAGLTVFTRPAPLNGTEDALAGYDLVVLDGVAPAPAPHSGRFLYLDPSGPGSPFPAAGTVRDPVPTEMRRDHPLLRHVSLADLNIREARRLAVGRDDVVVAAALGVPLVVARERAGLRAVAVAFDLRRSDLPLRPTLPLLLANAVDWLLGPPPQVARDRGSQRIDAREADTQDAVAVAPSGGSRLAAAGEGGRRLRPADRWLLLALGLALLEWWAHRRRGFG
jgi:hypothetical protein